MRKILASFVRNSSLIPPLATLGVAALLLLAGSAWAQAPVDTSSHRSDVCHHKK